MTARNLSKSTRLHDHLFAEQGAILDFYIDVLTLIERI